MQGKYRRHLAKVSMATEAEGAPEGSLSKSRVSSYWIGRTFAAC